MCCFSLLEVSLSFAASYLDYQRKSGSEHDDRMNSTLVGAPCDSINIASHGRFPKDITFMGSWLPAPSNTRFGVYNQDICYILPIRVYIIQRQVKFPFRDK